MGYKYNENFSLHESNETTGYNWFMNTTKKFTLTGNIRQLTWNDNHDE